MAPRLYPRIGPKARAGEAIFQYLPAIFKLFAEQIPNGSARV